MRRADWTERLWKTVRSYEFSPFAWGDHDCCLLVARAIDSMTGSDHAARLGRCYHDKRSALRFIDFHGGIVSAVSDFLGKPVDDLPRRGDAALVKTEDGLGVGICVGSTIAVAGEDGIVFYPLSESMKAWRVD